VKAGNGPKSGGGLYKITDKLTLEKVIFVDFDGDPTESQSFGKSKGAIHCQRTEKNRES